MVYYHIYNSVIGRKIYEQIWKVKCIKWYIYPLFIDHKPGLFQINIQVDKYPLKLNISEYRKKDSIRNKTIRNRFKMDSIV